MCTIRIDKSFSLLIALLLTALAMPVSAQMRGGKGAGGGSGFVEQRDHDVRATGLVPAFPEGYACDPISSPYASPMRYDGSRRLGNRNEGLHGGIDITLKEGTPLLAVAGGKVIAKGTGGQLEGNYLWLQHAPADTGLSIWSYAKYQHLAEVPALNEGDAVRAGQIVARSGNTGTVGGYYGAAGYAHLHLTIFAGPSEQYTKIGMYGSMIRAQDASLVDPLVLYVSGIDDPASAAALPQDRKRVRVAVVSDAGTILPPESKVVWPVACRSGK